MNTEFLTGLNERQHEAVTLPHQSALILAGAGSGKTRVLTTRIAWLIQTGQASPAGLLAVTFTNKTAKEITFGAQAFPISSSVNFSEIQNISEQANVKLGNFFMEVDTRTRHGPILFSLHTIKYQDVVPKRMLLRAAKEFSSAFETAVSMDRYNHLKSAIN